MKRRFVPRICITLCLFHYISIPLDSALAERKAIPIGFSNSARATAFNNARKIVRTSDDIRLVVYQDSLDTKSVVMWTWSEDGFIWSRPEVLGYGEFPALAIDSYDRIYAAWSNPDSLQIHFTSFQRVSPSSRKFKLTGTYNENVGMRGRHVSLEASASGLHLVVEYGAWISYAHYSKDTFIPYYFYNNITDKPVPRGPDLVFLQSQEIWSLLREPSMYYGRIPWTTRTQLESVYGTYPRSQLKT